MANPNWIPGVSGNPGGTTKVKLFRQALRECLSLSEAKILAQKLIGMAKDGNLEAMNMIADRLDGKPRQEIDINDERRSENLAERFEQILTDAASRNNAAHSAGRESGTGRVN